VNLLAAGGRRDCSRGIIGECIVGDEAKAAMRSAALKAMLEASPADWPRLAGFQVGRAEVIDADVSTVTAATDKVVRLFGGPNAIMHFDFQAGPDASLPRRVHGYNALLEERHGLPVHSVVVLLRPQADLRSITGQYERLFPGVAEPYLTFRYQVIRVWQLPAEQLLAGGLGTLPLAPIGAVTEAELPGVIERLKEKLAAPRYRKAAGALWTAVDVLMGLRYERALIEQLLLGVRGMKESVTYQAIVEEGVAKGELRGARRILLLSGEEQFGAPPAPRARATIEAINSLEQLDQLTRRMRRVGSWEELLADMPAPQTRRERGKRR
jgi:predicted transposase YdaD